MDFISQNDAYIFWGVFIPLFCSFLLFCFWCSAVPFCGCLILFCLISSFLLGFVWWFWFCAYFCGVGVITTETSPRRWETSADRNAGCCIFMEFVVYIIPKTTGVGFSKRWIPLHKTTGTFFEGFSHHKTMASTKKIPPSLVENATQS